ncbi:cupin, partial [Mycolicibacterium elephantis]
MSLWNPRDVPPYPPPRYTQDEPEVSAWLKRGDEPPD